MGTIDRRAWGAAATLVALAALLLLAPQLPEPRSEDAFRVAAYGAQLAFFAVLVPAVVLLVAARTWPVRRLALACVGSFVALMALNVAEVEVASDVAKVLFGALAGAAISRAIERAWWLVPICLIVPVADAWSVFSEQGVTNAIVERAEQDRTWLDWPTIATPIAGYPYEYFGRIGIVDIVFAGVFLAAAVRWGLGVRRCAVALVLAFVGTTALVLEGADTAIPALPFICLAFLVACAPGLWRDARADWAART